MLEAARFLPQASVTAPTHRAACRIWDFMADTNVDEMELKDTERGGMGSKHSRAGRWRLGRGGGSIKGTYPSKNTFLLSEYGNRNRTLERTNEQTNLQIQQ